MNKLKEAFLELSSIELDSDFKDLYYGSKLINLFLDFCLKTNICTTELEELGFFNIYFFSLVEIRHNDEAYIKMISEGDIKSYQKIYRTALRVIYKALCNYDSNFKEIEPNYRLPFRKYLLEFKDVLYAFFDKNVFTDSRLRAALVNYEARQIIEKSKSRELKNDLLANRIAPANIPQELDFDPVMIKPHIEKTVTSIKRKSQDSMFFELGIIPTLILMINKAMREEPNNKTVQNLCSEIFHIAVTIKSHLMMDSKKSLL